MKVATKLALCAAAAVGSVEAFAPPATGSGVTASSSASTSALNFFGGGSGAKDLDEEVRVQDMFRCGA